MHVLWQRIMTVASPDEDVRRRGGMLILIIVSLLIIIGVVIPLTLLSPNPMPAVAAETGAAVGYFFAFRLARCGRVTMGSLLVIAIMLLSIIIPMIQASFIEFFGTATFLVMPLLVAVLILRPFHVWVVFAMILIGLVLSVVLSPARLLSSQEGWAALSSVTLLLGMVALFSFFAARVTVGALTELRMARFSAEQAATRLELANVELEHRVSRRTIELQETNQALALAQQIAHLGSWSWDLSTKDVWWSDELYRIYGLDPQLTRPSYELHLQLTHPDDRMAMEQTAQQALTEHLPFTLDYRIIRSDGRIRLLTLQGKVLFDQLGYPRKLIGAVRDITEQKLAEQQLRESVERYKLVGKATNDAIWDWDMLRNEVHWNEAIERSFGYAYDTIHPSLEWWSERIYPDDYKRVVADMQHAIDTGETTWSTEYRFRRGDDSYITVFERSYVARNEQGQPTRVIGVMVDITERKRTEELLHYQAFHDALTGLPNRSLFLDRVRRAIEHAHHHMKYRFAVLFLDLDRFKIVNDSLGHSCGDALLVAFARRIEAMVRLPGDIVARFGGDEFVILLDQIVHMDDARLAAERVQEECAKPFYVNGQEIFTNVSIGIVISSPEYTQAEDLLRDADVALYRAKMQGKARYALFDTAMHMRVMERLQLEIDLRRAIEREELRVYYQPIVALQTHTICGMEALVRWRHPTQGLMSPATFLPVAEETGLIVPIDWWVLRTAAEQLRRWQTSNLIAPSFYLSINLTGKQFTQPGMVEHVMKVLQETGLAAHHLQIEITETVLMEHIEAALQIVSRLREKGVQIAMDDFGTGYSSLSYLHRFPIDVLKIDRSFIRHMHEQQKNREIILTIIELAKRLGIAVTAEGIETQEQCASMQRLGCMYGQGYLFSQPVDQGSIATLLKNQGTVVVAECPRAASS